MRAIFISYRRSDAEGQARTLLKDLSARFGKDAVFIDVAGMTKGRDFRHVLDERLSTCGVLLAMIGKDWLQATDDDGKRRLDDPKDFVRLETAAALKRDIPVIPVLVRGARMPRADVLPEDLKDLVFRDGVELTHARWDSDVEELIKALTQYVDARKSGFPSWWWRVPVALVALAFVGAVGYVGYGKYQYELALKEKAEATAAELKRVAAEATAKADAEERARLKAAADANAAKLEAAKAKAETIAQFGNEATSSKPTKSPGYTRLIASKETGDTFQFLQVSPPFNAQLIAGTPTEFKFRVRYSLQSRDKAVFAVSIAQTSPTATGCDDPGQLVDYNKVTIQRGQGEIDLSVLWHGGQTKDGIQAKGFLYPAPSLWDFPGWKIVSKLENVPEACWRFGR